MPCRVTYWGQGMNKLRSSNNYSDRSDHSDQIDIASLFRSKLLEQRLNHSDHAVPNRSGGPSGLTADMSALTKNIQKIHSSPSAFVADPSIKHVLSSRQPEEGNTYNSIESPHCAQTRRAEPIRELSQSTSNRSEIDHSEHSVSTLSDAFPYGLTVGCRPLTHSGRVVSLQAWRNLTEWELNGPNGRIWNGLTRS